MGLVVSALALHSPCSGLNIVMFERVTLHQPEFTPYLISFAGRDYRVILFRFTGMSWHRRQVGQPYVCRMVHRSSGRFLSLASSRTRRKGRRNRETTAHIIKISGLVGLTALKKTFKL
jgi:hypothetical protein